jgi:hypothetical protein
LLSRLDTDALNFIQSIYGGQNLPAYSTAPIRNEIKRRIIDKSNLFKPEVNVT